MSGVDSSAVRELASDLRASGEETARRMRLVVQKVAADVKRDAQIGAPVDTGFLRSSISYETRAGKFSARAEIGPTANYGAFVELGTSRMGARPYLFPAMDRHEATFLAAMKRAADPRLI